jgi:hypothetical protein
MIEQIHSRIRRMFDVPQMQNNIRGLWVEAMMCELLGEDWKYTGADWAAWDFERSDGLRLEVKQSAAQQSWGPTVTARFSIAAAKGFYPDGKTYIENPSGRRLSDIYVFAWHEGKDQRDVEEWEFFIVDSKLLAQGQKTIGLNAVRGLVAPVGASGLCEKLSDPETLPSRDVTNQP